MISRASLVICSATTWYSTSIASMHYIAASIFEYMFINRSLSITTFLLKINLIFFRLIEVSTKKERKTFHPFLVDTSINRKNIILICYHLIFIAFQQKTIILTLLNAGFFSCKNHLNFLTNQNKRYAIILINNK